MTRAERTKQKLEAQAAKWNATHPVGTVVRYWTGLREGEGRTGATRHAASVMCDHVSVWIEGCSGSVCLSHVEVVK